MAQEEEEVFTDILTDDDIQAIRPTTDANLLIQILVGFVGTVLTGIAVIPLKNTTLSYFYGVVNDRGPVQYLELFMFFMIIGLIILKYRIIKRQSRAVGDVDIDTNIDFQNDEEISGLRASVQESKYYDSSIAISRMDRLLVLWLHSKEVDRVTTYATTEADRGANASTSTYALSSVLIWAIPIMGFIGTVMGLGNAVGGFSSFLAGAADLGSIKGAIGDVTKGLGVAFDTTLLALVLSVLAMFPLSSVKRREEILYGEIDNYLEDNVISHLPSTEQQPIVIENLEDSIEAAFRRYIPDPDRYDEVFTRSIEKASSMVEEKFSGLAKGYESTLHDLTARLTASMATVGESLDASMRKVLISLREQEDAFLASRQDIGRQEGEHLKSLVTGLSSSAQGMADQYRQSADGLQSVTRESSEKSIQASMQLADRMQEITRLAGSIQDLLKIEESMEKSLKGISASEEFGKTLQDLRSHLSTTTEFCNRMSKPRVIKLREVVGE
jgi:biopolymer transport protein ExbB/TolQ